MWVVALHWFYCRVVLFCSGCLFLCVCMICGVCSLGWVWVFERGGFGSLCGSCGFSFAFRLLFVIWLLVAYVVWFEFSAGCGLCV